MKLFLHAIDLGAGCVDLLASRADLEQRQRRTGVGEILFATSEFGLGLGRALRFPSAPLRLLLQQLGTSRRVLSLGCLSLLAGDAVLSFQPLGAVARTFREFDVLARLGDLLIPFRQVLR